MESENDKASENYVNLHWYDHINNVSSRWTNRSLLPSTPFYSFDHTRRLIILLCPSSCWFFLLSLLFHMTHFSFVSRSLILHFFVYSHSQLLSFLLFFVIFESQAASPDWYQRDPMCKLTATTLSRPNESRARDQFQTERESAQWWR